MAILILEGFDAYGTSIGGTANGYLRKWNTSQSTLQVAAGRIGGNSLRISESTVSFLQKTIPQKQTVIVACAIFVNTHVSPSAPVIIQLREGVNTGLAVALNASREFVIFRGSTQLAVSSGFAVNQGDWFFVEFKGTIDNSVGAYELRINGDVALSASNVDTQQGSNAYCDSIVIGAISTGGTGAVPFYDDLYVLDTTGAVNNDFLGSLRVQTLFPSGDSDVDCTPSTGSTNYDLVNENPGDSDTSYVTGDTGDVDLYDYPTIDGSEVYAVQVSTVCRETDANPFGVKQLAKSGTTTGSSSGEVIGSTSYLLRSAIFEANPDTTDPWTPSEVNAAQFGFEIE